jgi:hypothetical protein
MPCVKPTSQQQNYGVPYNSIMYVIAIGWIYVTLLMAVTETNVTAGILTFALYGLMPLSLLLWIFGTPGRRRRLRRDAEALDHVVGEGDRADPGTDQ